MKLHVNRDVLADAVAWTARILPSRPAVPVLGGILLDAYGEDLTLSAFDYEVSARATVEAEVAEPGRALIPGRVLAEITKSLPDRPVEIVTDGSEAILTCGSTEFGLAAPGTGLGGESVRLNVVCEPPSCATKNPIGIPLES